MKLNIFGLELTFSFWFFTVLTSVLLLGRSSLTVYFLIPVIIHELGHLIALKACGAKISGISFSASGIEIIRKKYTNTSYIMEIIITLGGIAANLMTAAMLLYSAFRSMRVMLFISSNVAVALFNALPIGNLDGGQLLRLVLMRFGSMELASFISKICSFVMLIPLFALAIFLVLRGDGNVTLLIACVYLAGVVVCQKI